MYRTLASGAAAVALFATSASAQVFGTHVGNASNWKNMSSVNINNNNADAFWDRTSQDANGASVSCNVGHFLAGSFSSGCKNQKPVGLFPDNIGLLGQGNGSFLVGNGAANVTNGSRNFGFLAGTYQIDFLANIAGYDAFYQNNPQQSLRIFGADGMLEQVYRRDDGQTSLILDIDQDWWFGANTFNPFGQTTYSQVASGTNRFVLFSEAKAEDQPQQNGSWFVGFEDNLNGDWDFNDLVVRVSLVQTVQVPEPASLAMIGFGLVGLAGAGFRRRKLNA